MRKVLISDECLNFVEANDPKLIKKFQYLLQILIEQKRVHSDIVKKLIGTPFYELRINVNQEFRIILFTNDHDNFAESNNVILLNGFIKKSTKDYLNAIEIAKALLKYKKENNE
ncbi:MAG: type II toxin-antitoxin system RelE/ParE family toxin [Saprospiraceae bacterium]